MAETQTPESTEPPGYSPKKWDAQAVAVGQKMNLWAMLLAEEVAFSHSEQERQSPEYQALAEELTANFELLAQGRRLPGNPSDTAELPRGIAKPGPFEDMIVWLKENADRLKIAPSLINEEENRTNYYLLSHRTPVTDNDARTASLRDISYPFKMDGGVGFQNREEFLAKYFQVASGTEIKGGPPQFDEPPPLAQAANRSGTGPAIGVTDASPKQALTALAGLDIVDMQGQVPEQMGKKGELANIQRIKELAATLGGMVTEKEGAIAFKTEDSRTLQTISVQARELQTLASESEALYMYAPNLLDFPTFQQERGSVFLGGQLIDQVHKIALAAEEKNAPKPVPGVRLGDGVMVPDLGEFLDEMGDELLDLKPGGKIDPGKSLKYDKPLEAPKPHSHSGGQHPILSESNQRAEKWRASLARVDLSGLHQVTHTPDAEMAGAPQRDLPQVMAENTRVSKQSSIA